MSKRKRGGGGFAIAETLLVLVIIAIAGFVAWFVIQAKHSTDKNLDSTLASDKANGSDNAGLQYDLSGINSVNNQINADFTASNAALSDSSTFTSLPEAPGDTELKLIVRDGNEEIDRRLKTLNTLSIKITGAKKLDSTDKTSLNDEVKAEINGLIALKKKINARTDLAAAQSDAQSIFSGYRVYALIVPKVQLIKTADSLQVAGDKLITLAAKLQNRINIAKKQGEDTASLQRTLDNMSAKAKDAQTIAGDAESNLINLQPGDYNSNHSILSDSRNTLKIAQENIKAAATEAKTIVSNLVKRQ